MYVHVTHLADYQLEESQCGQFSVCVMMSHKNDTHWQAMALLLADCREFARYITLC